MPRKVFYSFHYRPDCQRAAKVRNIGVVEGNRSAKDNEWESITKCGDTSIQGWIDSQLDGKSCTVVLIGANTAGRKWIKYEIAESWKQGKGLVGIYIHNITNLDGEQSAKGRNPFADFTIGSKELASIIKAYNPPYTDTKQVYAYISEHLEDWIEEAIAIREQY